MASASIKKVGNDYFTEIRNSEGNYVKTIVTDPSQIRYERESCLYQPFSDVIKGSTKKENSPYLHELQNHPMGSTSGKGQRKE